MYNHVTLWLSMKKLSVYVFFLQNDIKTGAARDELVKRECIIRAFVTVFFCKAQIKMNLLANIDMAVENANNSGKNIMANFLPRLLNIEIKGFKQV